MLIVAAVLTVGGVVCFLLEGSATVPIPAGQSLTRVCASAWEAWAQGTAPDENLVQAYVSQQCDSHRRNKAVAGTGLILIGGVIAILGLTSKRSTELAAPR